jgi:flagellar protein FlaG
MEMINNIVSFPQLPDATQVKPVNEAAKPVAAAEASSAPKEQNQGNDLSQKGQDKGPAPEYSLRLTVDKDPNTGDWVYKAIDRYTGEVVRQLPRQELLDMKKSGNYQAGSVIKTDV